MKPLDTKRAEKAILTLAFLLHLIGICTAASYKCNPKLMRTFRLQGLKYSVSQEMEICPTVRDTCCTIIDQVRIMELWKKTSFPRIKTHIENMKKWDHKVLGLHNKLRKLKKEDMVFFFKREKMLTFHNRYCGMTTKNRELNAEEKVENMDWMLPGEGIIMEYDQKTARTKAWKEMKKGLNKDTPLYRFLRKSTRLFYEEFRWIARVMYYVNELPFYHRKYIAVRDRFNNWNFKKKGIPPIPKIRKRKVRKRSFRKKQKKPEFYYFIDKNNNKVTNEVDILYGRKKRIPEQIKYSARGRQKVREGLKKDKRKKQLKEAMRQYKKMTPEQKQKLKKMKKGRRLRKGRVGRHLFDESGEKTPQKRELKDNDKAKTKQGQGGQATQAQVDKSDYNKEPIPEIKVRRRKKKLVYAGGGASNEDKGRKWLGSAFRKRRKLFRKHKSGDRKKIHKKRKFKSKMMKKLLKKGHLRRNLHKMKRKHKKEGRKLNNLKDQISTQWNSLFGAQQNPPQNSNSLPQVQTQMPPNPNQMMQAGYTPQQIAEYAQMQQNNRQGGAVMSPQMMIPQQAQMQNAIQQQQQVSAAQANTFSHSPGEQGNIQYQNMQYSSQPGGQPVQINPQAYQNMPPSGYPWNQMYAAQMQNQQAQAQQPQVRMSNGRILEEIKDHKEDEKITQRFKPSPARNLRQIKDSKTKNSEERNLNLKKTKKKHLKALRPSDKEIIQKFKVTQKALEAMKALKFKYGKKLYRKHMSEIRKKTKFFSNFVLKGDPIKKMEGLERKLTKAVLLIQKRTGRKMFLDDINDVLFGKKKGKGKNARHKPSLAERGWMLTKWNMTFLKHRPSKSAPKINQLLRIIKYPKWKRFAKEDLKIKNVNKYLLEHGLKKLGDVVKSKFLSLGFPVSRKYKIEFMLGISKNFKKNLKKMEKDRKAALKKVHKLEAKIGKLKKRLKEAIKDNNKNFAKLQAALAVPGEGPKPKDEDITKTKIEVDLTVTSLPKEPYIECGVSTRLFPYSEVNFSKRKQRFCMRTWRRFRRIRIKEIIEYVELSRNEMRTMLDMKKAMYCGVCDGTLQNNFDEDRKLILYSQRFCQDLVGEFQDYIKFRNIILINYYEDILQMLNCFTFSNAGGADFPMKTMLQVQKRRIKSVERCFKNLRQPTFYKHCYWVCSQFNIMKFNSFFDGDPELLKTLYMKFAMFLRKYKKYRQQVDGLGRIKKKKKRRRRRRRRRKKRPRKLRYHGRPDYTQVSAQQIGDDGLVKGDPLKFQNQKRATFQAQAVKNQRDDHFIANADINIKSDNAKKTTQKDATSLKKNNKILKSMNKKKRVKKKKKSKESDYSIADQISDLILKHKQKMIKKTRKHSIRKKIREYRSSMKNKKIISTIHVPTEKELGIHKKRKLKSKHKKLLDIDGVEKQKPEKSKKLGVEKSDKISDNNKKSETVSDKNNNKKSGLEAPKNVVKPAANKTGKKSHPERILTSVSEIFANDIQNELLQQRMEEEENKRLSIQHKKNANLFLTEGPEEDLQRELYNDRPERRPKRGEMMRAIPKRRMRAHEKIKRRISFMKLHTESDNLPRYSDYRINTSLNPVYREVLQQTPIYQQGYEPMEIHQFRPFFTYSIHGFNPLRAQELMQMDFKPQQIVRLTKLTNFKTEKLTRKAVLQYLNLTRDDMANFNNDFKMKINPLHQTDHKSYHSTPPYPKWRLHSKFKRFKRDYEDEKKPQFKDEFDNPDMYHFRDHYRNNTSNDHVSRLWYQIFGKS